MGLYKLPIGIRIPENDEYIDKNDIKLINDERNLANIIEGFTIREVTDAKFSHYAEVNVDADKIWDVFCELTNKLIGDVAYGILGFKDDEPTLSQFTKAERVIEIFKKYKFELTNDGFLAFGIANYNKNSLDEILVSSFKYLKIWTTKKELLIKVLNGFGIQQIGNLQFIDEFPVVSEALSDNIDKGIRHYSEVMECVEGEFQKL